LKKAEGSSLLNEFASDKFIQSKPIQI
jgi:hypothetical protein